MEWNRMSVLRAIAFIVGKRVNANFSTGRKGCSLISGRELAHGHDAFIRLSLGLIE